MGSWTMNATGFDEFAKKLEKAGNAGTGICKAALYDGAAVLANAYRSSLQSIKTEPFRYVKDGDEKRLPSPEEKAAVLHGTYGIAKMRVNGYTVDTIIGVKPDAGYVKLMGKTVPTAVILRAINSGTSFMLAQPVLRKAANAAKKAAVGAMSATAEDRIQKLFK